MRGLYLITNDDDFDVLYAKLQAALATKQLALLQYRRKNIDKTKQYAEIEQIQHLCQRYDVPLIINDDLEQAAHFGLHLHLGQNDGSLQEARQVLGEKRIIGRTCLNSVALAEQAIADGASYVAFGAIYGSQTKPQAITSGLTVVQQAARHIDMPICAIGGLRVENAAAVISAGASLCAVVGDILSRDVSEIPQRIEAWATLFERD